MAEQLDRYEFKHGSGPRRKRLPWNKWLNGKPWKLMAGEDFTTTIDMLRSAAWGAARTRGGRVCVHAAHDHSYAVVQFFRDEP